MLNFVPNDGHMPSCAVDQVVADNTPDDVRSVLSPQQEARVRRTIVLVEEFRADCSAGANAYLLSVVLQATIRCAQQLFAGSFLGECASPQFADDSHACLDDLLRMHKTLCGGAMPPAFDLVHAMDALIIQLARITVFSTRVPATDA